MDFLVERRLGRFVPILILNMDFRALGPESIKLLPFRYMLSTPRSMPSPGMNPPILLARFLASFFALLNELLLVARFLRLGCLFAMTIPQHILWMCMIPQEVALDHQCSASATFQPPVSPNLGGHKSLGHTPKTPAEGESLCTPLSLSASLQVLDFTGMTCIRTYSTMADVYVIILANCVGKYSNLKGGKRCSSAR